MSWFMDTCWHESPLWCKLRRASPRTLAETMKIADKYALGDPTQVGRKDNSTSKQNRNDRNDFQNKRRVPDFRYPQNQVATVEEVQPDLGNNQRQMTGGPGYGQKNDGKKPWNNTKRPDDKDKYTIEMMLD